MKRFWIYFMCCLLLVGSLPLQASATESSYHAPRVQQPRGDKWVIVLDPGHGGEQEGTIENGFLEKEMDLITARAIYEELLQYDNIEVHMTRTEDVKLTLKERAEFAAGVNADFLFSIHYNASVDHDLFGAETWISAFAPFNAYGYQFGYVQMLTLQDMGLYLRGVKTKLGDKGKDYYGIIREATALNIPATIIEHCHVDEARDAVYCDTEEELIAFGKADALAIAKYLGLASESLGVDYSEYALSLPQAEADIVVQSTIQDESPPEICNLELLDTDLEGQKMTFRLTAADYDSPLLYYQYSIDNGATYSALQPWPGCDVIAGTYTDTFTFDIEIPEGAQPHVKVMIYNLFDVFTESNDILSPYTFPYENTIENTDAAPNTAYNKEQEKDIPGTTTFMPTVSEEVKDEDLSFMSFLKLCVVIVLILFVTLFVSQLVYYRNKRKRRRQRRNVSGNNRNQPR